ncbi:MAG: PilZ domain-containing protein [Acidobacteriota bacterium]|nr:PilZ domain-containing protein [Acidobacteriota bacterium]
MKKRLVDEAAPLAEGGRGFSFPLPTQVEGQNARGAEFSEATILMFINHQGTTFNLKSPVAIGTRLKLIIDLPEKLAEDKALKMVIKGRVVMIEMKRNPAAGQKVTVHFDSRYIIKPDAS